VDATGKECEREAYNSFHHEDLSQLTSLWVDDLNLSVS
jgi:hypothetical protein